MDITKEWLETEYGTNKRSLRSLGVEKGVSHQTIAILMAGFGIPRRGRASRVPELHDLAMMKRLYLVEKMSTIAIAEHIGCDQSAVAKALRRLGVTLRSRARVKKVNPVKIPGKRGRKPKIAPVLA